MTTVTTAGVLEGLSKDRLIQIGRDFGVALGGIKSTDTKEAQIQALSGAKMSLADVLQRFTRDELRAVCRLHGRDHSGRSRGDLMERLGVQADERRARRVTTFEAEKGLPRQGDIAVVRHRQYMVQSVHLPDRPEQHTLVKLVCLDDDNAGRQLEVLWERELGARALAPEDKGLGTIDKLDPPRHFAAYLHALKWNRPWLYFVHEGNGQERCSGPRLTLKEGTTGDFSEVTVKCVCGANRRLANATTPDANPTCRGYRPWLGPGARETCDQRPRLLMLRASNAYFSQVVSALTIPESDSVLDEKVRQLMGVLTNATPELLTAVRAIPLMAPLANDSDEDILAAVQRIKNPKETKRAPLRTAEFQQFTNQPDYHPGVLPGPDDLFFARRYKGAQAACEGLAQVVLAPRLRQVNVQVGFTRLEAPTSNLQGEYDLGVTTCRLGLNTDWLPASEVWGEGVFLQLDEARVKQWENRPEVQMRQETLLAGYKKWAEGQSAAPEFPGVRFYLLHSLSHLLMNAISIECGYSASALAERIYCTGPGEKMPMAGILISTGTPGTEGTLGGLVEQGKVIKTHLQRAFDMGRLCSNDPVCSFHKPGQDPTGRLRHGAACHGCLYVAEPSCERFNVYLDRALVVPTLGHPEALAFFEKRPT